MHYKLLRILIVRRACRKGKWRCIPLLDLDGPEQRLRVLSPWNISNNILNFPHVFPYRIPSNMNTRIYHGITEMLASSLYVVIWLICYTAASDHRYSDMGP
jgi:hypothetical protein